MLECDGGTEFIHWSRAVHGMVAIVTYRSSGRWTCGIEALCQAFLEFKKEVGSIRGGPTMWSLIYFTRRPPEPTHIQERHMSRSQLLCKWIGI